MYKRAYCTAELQVDSFQVVLMAKRHNFGCQHPCAISDRQFLHHLLLAPGLDSYLTRLAAHHVEFC